MLTNNMLITVTAALVVLATACSQALPASQPSCYMSTDTAWAQCSNLAAGDIGMLQSTLANMSVLVPAFSVSVDESDSSAFPETLFNGYAILEIDLQQDGLTAMPTALLSYVGPQLVSLDLSVNAITTISAVAAQYAVSIQTLDYAYNGATVLNDDSFAGYTALSSLYLNNNGLTAINAPFAGLTSLVLLSLTSNSIASVAPTAFTELGALQFLELDHNLLTTLTNGTFDSLTNVVQVALEGNPFDCVCSLQWLKDWLNAKNLLSRSKAACATPTAGAFADIDFCAAK